MYVIVLEIGPESRSQNLVRKMIIKCGPKEYHIFWSERRYCHRVDQKIRQKLEDSIWCVLYKWGSVAWNYTHFILVDSILMYGFHPLHFQNYAIYQEEKPGDISFFLLQISQQGHKCIVSKEREINEIFPIPISLYCKYILYFYSFNLTRFIPLACDLSQFYLHQDKKTISDERKGSNDTLKYENGNFTRGRGIFENILN